MTLTHPQGILNRSRVNPLYSITKWMHDLSLNMINPFRRGNELIILEAQKMHMLKLLF